MKVILNSFWLLVLILFLITSCNYEHPKVQPQAGPGPGKETWFQLINRTIVQPKCMGCHMENTGKKKDYSNYDLMMASGNIIPGKPDDSTFYLTVKAGSMPKNGNPLSDDEKKVIRNWIAAGANVTSMAGEVKPPDPEPDDKPKPTYSWIYKNVFVSSCNGCHSEHEEDGKMVEADGGTDLSTYEKMMKSEGMLMIPIVEGKPKQSGVYDQIAENLMPKDGNPCPQEVKQAIFDWIKNGAKKD